MFTEKKTYSLFPFEEEMERDVDFALYLEEKSSFCASLLLSIKGRHLQIHVPFLYIKKTIQKTNIPSFTITYLKVAILIEFKI